MGGNSSKSPPNGGLRVHRVYPNGPGDVAGIEPFFDYVLDADGYTYTDDSDETLNLFTKYVNDHENQQICLNVYNARKKSIREVFIVPQKWDGIGLLGLTLKFGLFTCLDQGAHVIHIYDKSPAQKAGLMPITDYLLGTNLQLFFDLDCVRIHVANQVDKEIVLIVYNSVTETVRRAVIVPKENWGGKGTLGCDLAKGYIHRIPYVKSLFTYPTIDSYPTFDSNLSKEVVDTIDLSIGNVDNYYNSSNNTTMRQDPMISDRTESSLERDKGTHGQTNYTTNTSGHMDTDNEVVVDRDNSLVDSDPGYNINKMDSSNDSNNLGVDPTSGSNEVFSTDTLNLGNSQTLDLDTNNYYNDGRYNTDNNNMNVSNLVYTSENLLGPSLQYEPKIDPELGGNVHIHLDNSNQDNNYSNTGYNNDFRDNYNNSNQDNTSNDKGDKDNELNSDYNQFDLNNSYQPPSMLNLDFTNYDPNNNLNNNTGFSNNNSDLDLNSFSDHNTLSPQVNPNNLNNPENLVNPLYNSDRLFTQDSDNV